MKKFFSEFITWSILVFYAIWILISFCLRTGNNFKGYQSFLVQSGSMEPVIMTGDVIVIKSELEYRKNNAITFKDSSGHIVTHRIMEIKDGRVITKGDANRSTDNGDITINQILGKVVFVIPHLGFLIVFSKSLPGLILLVFLPILFLVISSIFDVKNNK